MDDRENALARRGDQRGQRQHERAASGASYRGRARFFLAPVVVALIAVVVPVVWGTVQIRQYAVSTDLGVFVLYAGSPVMLIVPFLAAWAGNSRLYAELGHRQLANVRVRQSPERLLRGRLLRSFLIPGAIFAGSVLVVSLIAFAVWPSLGNPFVDPSVNFLKSTQDAAVFDRGLTGFSQLTVFGYPVFGVVSAVWAGFAAGVYGAFAAAALILLENRVLALLIPMGVYLVETIAAAVTVGPYAGLLYSYAPTGLQQVPIVVTMAPTLLLAVVVGLIWTSILRRRDDLRAQR